MCENDTIAGWDLDQFLILEYLDFKACSDGLRKTH